VYTFQRRYDNAVNDIERTISMLRLQQIKIYSDHYWARYGDSTLIMTPGIHFWTDVYEKLIQTNLPRWMKILLRILVPAPASCKHVIDIKARGDQL